MAPQNLSTEIGAYEIKATIEYKFDATSPHRKFKCIVKMWLPASEFSDLHERFINTQVMACGECLDETWGEYDHDANARVSEVDFLAYGWASAQALAKDYLSACVRTVRGVYRRNTEAMDAMPPVAEETHLVA